MISTCERGYALESEDDDRKVISQSESQRIAYVGSCAVVIQKMIQEVSIEEMVKEKVKVRLRVTPKQARGRHRDRRMVKKAVGSMEAWALKILGRLYYHIGVEPPEEKMIESLSTHGVRLRDLVPPLVEMKEVMNPLNDLFLVLIADSVYDSRSRSLLCHVGFHLSLSWWDIVVFEGRIGKAWEVTC